MHSCAQSSNPPAPPPPLDLSADSPDIRGALYERVAGVLFAAPEDRPGDPTPAAAAERAGLRVLFLFERYFAIWTLPPEAAAHLPACRRVQMVRVLLDPTGPSGLA